MGSARDRFLSALPAADRDRWIAHAPLETELAAALAAACAAWPTLPIDADALVDRLAAGSAGTAAPQTVFANVIDLALTDVAATGHPEAMRLFDQRYVTPIAPAVARFRLRGDQLDELKQSLRRQLLIAAPGQRPRIAGYSGRGSLDAWLRVAAVRAAIKLKRGVAAHRIDDDHGLADVASGGPSPQVSVLTAEARALFRTALRTAIGSLPAQEQNVLRQHHLDGLTLDQLAALYHVHRTTVGYWLERARARLFKRTRSALIETTGMTGADCDSLFHHASSQLAVTLRGLFDA